MLQHSLHLQGAVKMGEKFTSRVGFLIRNFRIAAEMTQKELADKCGLNESTIRNYELGNRYPDEATLLNIANNLGVSFYALSDLETRFG
jgi:transcriptional regulator with XRE-family HTH domain